MINVFIKYHYNSMGGTEEQEGGERCYVWWLPEVLTKQLLWVLCFYFCFDEFLEENLGGEMKGRYYFSTAAVRIRIETE